jgi:hypothetical protein
MMALPPPSARLARCRELPERATPCRLGLSDGLFSHFLEDARAPMPHRPGVRCLCVRQSDPLRHACQGCLRPALAGGEFHRKPEYDSRSQRHNRNRTVNLAGIPDALLHGCRRENPPACDPSCVMKCDPNESFVIAARKCFACALRQVRMRAHALLRCHERLAGSDPSGPPSGCGAAYLFIGRCKRPAIT